MEQLKKALSEAYPDIDFDTEKTLIDSGLLDSVAVVNVISIIEDLYDISVTMEYIQPPYFQSVETMWEMIEELQ